MKKIIYALLILINFNLYSNLENKLNDFNNTQFASFLKSIGLLYCGCKALKISFSNSKATINWARAEYYDNAFENFIIASSTFYASYFLLNKSFYHLKHALNIK